MSKHGESSLPNALPWDEVDPARYIAASAPVEIFSKAKTLHEKRIKTDKLFQLLLEELKLINEASTRKTVSLDTSKRKIEREKLKKAKRDLDNEYRIAQGLEPLLDDTEAEAEAGDDAEDTDPIDILLEETAHILSDLISPSQTTASTQDEEIKRSKPVTIFGTSL